MDDVKRQHAAKILGLSERTLDRRKDIPKIHVGRRVYVSAAYILSHGDQEAIEAYSILMSKTKQESELRSEVRRLERESARREAIMRRQAAIMHEAEEMQKLIDDLDRRKAALGAP